MPTCQYKVGFLSLKECENPVTGVCSQCNRLVCAAHTRMGDGLSTCLECYAQNPREPEETDEEAQIARERHAVQNSYTYGTRDYMAFYNKQQPGNREPLRRSNFQDS